MKQEYTIKISEEVSIGIRDVATERVWHWLMAAWEDIQQVPAQSLFFGACLTLLSLVIFGGIIASSAYYLFLPSLAGFLLVAPFIGIGCYSLSQQRESGEGVSLKSAALAWSRNSAQVFGMGLVLLVGFGVWLLLAWLVFFGFHDGPAPEGWLSYLAVMFGSLEGLQILSVGTLVGGLLALAVFAISAVSIPMLMDRPVNIIAAMRTSWAAVKYNVVTMLLWAGILVAIIAAGFFTGFLGFVIGFPLAAHATWHAYRDLVV
jgi:uncharacterized membrane protein